jgi:O-methyltransferase
VTRQSYSSDRPPTPARTLLSRVSAAALRASIILDFMTRPYGAAYGVSARDRFRLVMRFHQIVRTIPAGTTALSHIILAREILSIPPLVSGDVIECGTWKGASTASLSLVCHMVGRRLLVCDSFMGLPDTGVQLYLAPHSRTYGYLKGGMFCGSLAEVQANVNALGQLETCDFVLGFFAESLKRLAQPIVFAFLDVDLPFSFQDCLKAIWPSLVDNGAIYVDDVGCMNIVRVFFDDMWWKQHLGCPAPGLVGSGCGLPIHPDHSNIGYVRKLPPFQPGQWQQDPDLYYPVDHEDSI